MCLRKLAVASGRKDNYEAVLFHLERHRERRGKLIYLTEEIVYPRGKEIRRLNARVYVCVCVCVCLRAGECYVYMRACIWREKKNGKKKRAVPVDFTEYSKRFCSRAYIDNAILIH